MLLLCTETTTPRIKLAVGLCLPVTLDLVPIKSYRVKHFFGLASLQIDLDSGLSGALFVDPTTFVVKKQKHEKHLESFSFHSSTVLVGDFIPSDLLDIPWPVSYTHLTLPTKA